MRRDEARKEILFLYEQGYDLDFISYKTLRTQKFVYSILLENNVKIRPEDINKFQKTKLKKIPAPIPLRSYESAYKKTLQTVKQLISTGKKVEYYPHFIMINGVVYNGVDKKVVEKLMRGELV